MKFYYRINTRERYVDGEKEREYRAQAKYKGFWGSVLGWGLISTGWSKDYDHILEIIRKHNNKVNSSWKITNKGDQFEIV